MTTLNIAPNQNPARILCDYLHIWEPWKYRIENVIHKDKEIHKLDLVRVDDGIIKTLHIENIDGLGLSIVNISFSLSDIKGIAA